MEFCILQVGPAARFMSGHTSHVSCIHNLPPDSLPTLLFPALSRPIPPLKTLLPALFSSPPSPITGMHLLSLSISLSLQISVSFSLLFRVLGLGFLMKIGRWLLDLLTLFSSVHSFLAINHVWDFNSLFNATPQNPSHTYMQCI